MKNAIMGLFTFLVIIFFGWAFVLTLNELNAEQGKAKSQTEALFKSACVAVNGNAVFNGKNWECLK